MVSLFRLCSKEGVGLMSRLAEDCGGHSPSPARLGWDCGFLRGQ